MLSRAHGEVGSVLFSLFWSVQGSLLSWCFLQLKSTDTAAKELATDLIEKCECQQSMVTDRCQNLTWRECPSSVTRVLTYQVCMWLPVSQPCNRAGIYLSSQHRVSLLAQADLKLKVLLPQPYNLGLQACASMTGIASLTEMLSPLL